MFILFLILGVLNVSALTLDRFAPKNVITVPPNCPAGQELINGECRDVWKSGLTTPTPALHGQDLKPKNMITVPPNCPAGQEFINGACRFVWRGGLSKHGEDLKPKNTITVPPNCPAGQEFINGACRFVWKVKQ